MSKQKRFNLKQIKFHKLSILFWFVKKTFYFYYEFISNTEHNHRNNF